jgi:hypothetical protein
MSSSKIPAPRRLLPPVRPTLGTHSPTYHIAESRHVTDMAAVFTVCLCTANSGPTPLAGWVHAQLVAGEQAPGPAIRSLRLHRSVDAAGRMHTLGCGQVGSGIVKPRPTSAAYAPRLSRDNTPAIKESNSCPCSPADEISRPNCASDLAG